MALILPIRFLLILTLLLQVDHHCSTGLGDRFAEVFTTVGIDPAVHRFDRQVACDVAVLTPIDSSDETLDPVQMREVRALVTGMIVLSFRADVKLAGLRAHAPSIVSRCLSR